MTGVSISGSKNCVVDAYSYFEKGCRKKCTRQSRKVLWVILRSLFFKESQDRMAGEAMDLCLRVLKESNKSGFDSCKGGNIVLIIFHITFRDCRVHIFSDNPSRNSCIKNLTRPLRISHNTPCMPPKFYISIVSIEIKNIP